MFTAPVRNENDRLKLERAAIAGMIFGIAFVVMIVTLPASAFFVAFVDMGLTAYLGYTPMPFVPLLTVYILYLIGTGVTVAYLRYTNRLSIGG
jgi:hypothetical protein